MVDSHFLLHAGFNTVKVKSSMFKVYIRHLKKWSPLIGPFNSRKWWFNMLVSRASSSFSKKNITAGKLGINFPWPFYPFFSDTTMSLGSTILLSISTPRFVPSKLTNSIWLLPLSHHNTRSLTVSMAIPRSAEMKLSIELIHYLFPSSHYVPRLKLNIITAHWSVNYL